MELRRWSLSIIRDLVMAAHAESRAGSTRQARQQAVASLNTAMANMYSRGRAAMMRELQLRCDAIAVVASWLDGRPWSEAVPVQSGPPSFDFMFGADTAVADVDVVASDDGE